MTMTVRALIEHLARYDGDQEVKIRDRAIPMVLHDLPDHAVELEEFIDTRGRTMRETCQDLANGIDTSKFVVALG